MAQVRIDGFVWDALNTEKVGLHELAPDSIEAMFDQEPVILRHPERPNRYICLGLLPRPDSRFVLVAFEFVKGTRHVRVVTAFEPTGERWWRLYAKVKGSES